MIKTKTLVKLSGQTLLKELDKVTSGKESENLKV